MSIDTGLKRAREAAGLTQTDLGAAVGVTPQMINRIEAGTKLPSLPLTATIAEQLGTTVDALINGYKEDGQAMTGKALKHMRLDAGLTQKQLASASGRSVGTIQQYETGKRGLSVEALLRLAENVGISRNKCAGYLVFEMLKGGQAMKGPNDFCINASDGGLWGKLSNWNEISTIAKSGGRFISEIRYCGNYTDRSTKREYAVFYTPETNYIIPVSRTRIKEDKA